MSKPKMRVATPKVIVISFLGSITSDNWRDETVFPFVIANMVTFLEKHEKDSSVQILIHELRVASNNISRRDDNAPRIEDDDEPAAIVNESVAEFVKWQYKRKQRSNTIQQLEMKIVHEAFENGDLVTHVYDDVLESLKEWKKLSIKIYVDSPNYSSRDTELFLSKTTKGDLRSLFAGVFGNDPKYINDNIEVSYKMMFEETGAPTNEILLITHVGSRAKTLVEKLGVDCALIDRHENRKTRSYYLLRFCMVKGLDEIEFISTKNKLPA